MIHEISPIIVEDHLLWPDGSISVDPSCVIDFIFKLSANNVSIEKLFVTELSPEITEYNKVVESPISIKTHCSIDLPSPWMIPDHYKNLDLDNYLNTLFIKIEHDSLYELRKIRLSSEISLFKKFKLEEVLRTLIYVIDTLKLNNIVWGVGRGSSCSSYLLFLLDLHEIDSVKYDIPISDFL